MRLQSANHPTLRLTVRIVERLGRFFRNGSWLSLSFCLLVVGTDGSAWAIDVSTPSPPSADEEPITPIPPPPTADPLKLALGKRLFEDRRLSRDDTRSCSTCHDMQTNGADSQAHDTSIDGTTLPFNTSTLFNASLSFRLGWEGKFESLEEEAGATIVGPIMGASIDQVLAKLRNDATMKGDFVTAYGHDPDRASLLDAIAAYERSLVTPESRFDRWLGGDSGALSAEELRGYQLFKSFGCVSCHQGVNVGGNLFEKHGIFRPLAAPKPEILRVPSLRNVATTPPYFHDGSAPTLTDAVRQMACAQLDRKLSDDETTAIVAFLKTLTGTYDGRSVAPAAP